MLTLPKSRSRKGAWIEIKPSSSKVMLLNVAPVRERGLKSTVVQGYAVACVSRSRKGAWIEINT